MVQLLGVLVHRQPTGLVQALSSQCSGPHLKVALIGFGIGPPDFQVEIGGMCGEFPRIAEQTVFSSICGTSSNFHLFAKSSFKNFIAFGICDRASINGFVP
ncbi:hypothetical protein GOBAR_AA05646 [Gossypium barbadense]|uniref:Uncharacterized protein n=1 Tax=Gossypium barbadense TaxID=3634 RepID=A0A2P5YH64_GOSBA|nr:hypothetical protein GOBAR_AA05646 [Gossypium barbadense]